MFERAQQKLEEAIVHLDGLADAKDTQAFRSHFNAFVNAARAISNVLQKEGRHSSNFNAWYQEKQQEMRGDELLRFIHDARIEDFHQGKHRLQFPSAYIEHFSTNQAGPPPSPNASIIIGTEGPYWLVDAGTARERRIPVRQGGKWIVQVAIDSPPSSHLGQRLEKVDPITLCQLVVRYFETLLYEARTNIG